MRTTLSRTDYESFLIQVYFGKSYFDQPFLACVDRAYLDFNRTLHNLQKCPRAIERRGEARNWLAAKINALSDASGIVSQENFDKWHRDTCACLISTFQEVNFPFYAGQAQKWINMTLKYVFSFGEDRLSGFAALYELCHAPIDQIVIDRLARVRRDFPKSSKPWSRIDYGEYIECQQWIRNNFEIPPLDVEFRAWQKPEFDLSAAMRRPQQA
jgi:hypothetical protein